MGFGSVLLEGDLDFKSIDLIAPAVVSSESEQQIVVLQLKLLSTK